MIRLDKTLLAWGTPDFAATLKREIEQLDGDQLPLQQGLSTGNYVADEPISATILGIAELGGIIRIKAGIFYKGMMGGCSCTDDPTPASDINEYCEVQLDIDRTTAAAAVTLAAGEA